jgi:glycosyltransferase involved in cell wall biosynthesis
MKTLAICIPTFKRPDLLKRCILSAIDSAGSCPIRIFVADDSVDETNAFVREEITKAYSFIHWHSNVKNLGIDNNIQHVVDLCDCDFAWLIGEDDVFMLDAVLKMYELVQTVKGPFILANYAFVNEDPTHIISIALTDKFDSIKLLDEFLPNFLWTVGFIGACVINREAWGRTDPRPYDGTYFTHVGRIVELLAPHGSVHLVSKCCVANRVEGSDIFTWKRDSYGVFFGFIRMCDIVSVRIPRLASSMTVAGESFERRYRWLSLRLAMRLRSEAAFDYLQFKKYLLPSRLNPLKKFILLFISLAPSSVFRPMVRFYRMLRKRRC